MSPKIIPLQEHADDLNNISSFLAKKDIDRLESRFLKKKFGIEQADLLILLGNSIIYSAELVAEAYQNKAVKKILIIGGVGHSTQYLRDNVRDHTVYSGINVRNRSESEIFKDILVKYQNIDEKHIIIGSKSTNCGENAEEAYDLITSMSTQPKKIILMQDPTMQLRSYASFLKVWGKTSDTTFINYPPLIPFLRISNGRLRLLDYGLENLWGIERLISLILGEIPRLYDDENGYGPNGKGFITHVDIPADVMNSYERLLPVYRDYLKFR